MPTEVTDFENRQELKVGVNGPDGANRLFMTGIALVDFGGGSGGIGSPVTATEVFRFFLGPKLEHDEFKRAVATASPSSFVLAPNPSMIASWVSLASGALTAAGGVTEDSPSVVFSRV